MERLGFAYSVSEVSGKVSVTNSLIIAALERCAARSAADPTGPFSGFRTAWQSQQTY